MYHYNFGNESIVVDHELTEEEINAYIADAESAHSSVTLEDRVAELESALDALLSGRTN